MRTLVTHVIGNHHHMLGTLGEQHADDPADLDLPAAWVQARASVLAALSDPATAARVVTAPFGQVPFSELIGGLLSGDTLFHMWDLARAIGQDDRLDPAACEQVLAAMTPLDAGIRGPGRFADKIEPPAGADAQTRLLCFGGCKP